MEENISIGKIDLDKFKGISTEIITNEVVLTPERLGHIIERHKEDWDIYSKQIGKIIKEPDYILKNNKNIDTAMVVKHIDNTNINIVIRLAVANDSIHCKNSIMTLYRIRDKNLKKLMQKNKTVFTKMNKSDII